MLRFNGRPVAWFGVGASDVIGPGIAALEGKAAQYSGGGGFSPPPPPAAVAGLKAAGTAAVMSVGPAIDALSGNDPAVMKLTQQVYQLNSQLAGVDSSEGIGQAEVNAAKGIVDKMIFAYKQASNLASSLAPKTAADTAQGTATSRVNIPAPSPVRATRGPAPSAAPSTSPATIPDAPPPNRFLDWISSVNKVPLVIGGAVVLVGGVALAVAGGRMRGRATA